ncbi:MAG: cupredoxin domain-containing protein [Ilumatobacter sp.]|uniref:cupredoxin domain-containing protein n=1 Tax=Ilumatobacter sp. TaxID=1967498 RepID=UPI00260BA59E|nr:cupredoxin domain-containing protein [Ilumatobacter sp.]MDJ0768123.1 cupredoxin domain-containing protein [Ilumatobacter sp.]
MRILTPTLSICALAAAFTAGALTAAPDRPAPAGHAAHAAPAAGPGTAGGPAEAAPTDAAEVPTITISGFAFDTPSVPAGSTVRIVNTDSAPHTVTARDGSFDVFLDGGTETTFVVPTTAGTFDFFCTIHPSMTSSLVVT